MPVFKIVFNPANSSTTVVTAAQQIASAGNLTLAAGAAKIDSGNARILLITTGEDDSAVNAVITGLDADGNAISETIALPNHTTKNSVNAYASVSSIHLSAGITANMSVGTSNATTSGYSPALGLDYLSRDATQVMVEVTGTINFSIQDTLDPIMIPLNVGGTGTANATWNAPSALASKTSTTVAALDLGATGVRVLINSYSNGATLTARFSTPSNSNLG